MEAADTPVDVVPEQKAALPATTAAAVIGQALHVVGQGWGTDPWQVRRSITLLCMAFWGSLLQGFVEGFAFESLTKKCLLCLFWSLLAGKGKMVKYEKLLAIPSPTGILSWLTCSRILEPYPMKSCYH